MDEHAVRADGDRAVCVDSELASLHERLAVLAADLGRLGHDGHPELVVADHALRRAILLVRDLQTKAS